LPPSPAHLRTCRRVGDDALDRRREVDGELLGVARVVGHQPTGLAVSDDLRDTSDRARHDGHAAGHGFEVDDAQRLVDRRADEHRRRRQQGDQVGARQWLPQPHHPGALCLQAGDGVLDFGGDVGCVR